MAQAQRCRFCDERPAPDRIAGEQWWYCGTYTKDGEEFKTGQRCDMTVFRNAFINTSDALESLVRAVQSGNRLTAALEKSVAALVKHCGWDDVAQVADSEAGKS